MPQARDEAGNVWEVDAQGNAVRLISQAQAPNQPPADPTFELERPKAEADLARTQAQAQEITASLPSNIRKTQAEATQAEIDANAAMKEANKVATAEQQKATRSSFRTESVLQAIREARNIARDRGGTGWEAYLSGLPTTDALALKTALDPIKGNLSFGRLQEMRDESVTGGALGQVSNIELELLASTVASLEQKVDLQTFLGRLDKVEQHFINAQLSNDGYAKDDPVRKKLMQDQFGYTGVLDGEAPKNTASLGRQDATETAQEIPPEYQAQHLRYLRDNWGEIDPRKYASFRASLDESFGLTPDLEAYAASAPPFNQAAQEGVTPEQLGAVPNPSRELGMIEQGVNYAAQSAPGAFFANAGNAVSAGILAKGTGNQDNLELLREARPISSFLGEMGGATLGAAATGGFAGRAGMTLLGKPLAAETLHGGVYGATQDDNALRGAGMGVLGTLGGSLIGRQIGNAFPETFAGKALDDAEESLPNLEQLRGLENEAYTRAEQAGIAASPESTQSLFERAQGILRENEKITPRGRMVNTEGPINDGMRLLEDYAGQPMTPSAVSNVRNVLGEARMSPDRNQARIGRELLEDFDQWAEPALPGIGDARRIAQRRIEGEEMARASALANERGLRMKGNDVGDAARTKFGQITDQIADEKAFFTPQTTEAIQAVSRGDGLTNALRAIGKYSLSNPLTAGGVGTSGGLAGAGLVDPLYATTALGVGLFGSGARKAAGRRTQTAVRNAELTAIGGDEWRQLFEAAQQLAASRAGQGFGGASGVLAGSTNRQQQPLPR